MTPRESVIDPIRKLGPFRSYVTIHIDARGLRDDQNDDDRFELYLGGDPFWLNVADVIAFRTQLDAAVTAYEAAYGELPGADEGSSS